MRILRFLLLALLGQSVLTYGQNVSHNGQNEITLPAIVPNGDERIATTINEETGEEVEGQWEVYRNGKPLLDKTGKPITYPSNSQVGTKGFEYGF